MQRTRLSRRCDRGRRWLTWQRSTRNPDRQLPAWLQASFCPDGLIQANSEVNPNGPRYGRVLPCWGDVTGACQNAPVSHLAGRPGFVLVRQKTCEVIVKRLSSWLGILLLTAATSVLAQATDPAITPLAPPNAVPEGTTFLVRLQDRLDTAELHPGQHFKVRLDEDLVAANGNLVPRGKRIKGHVSSVEQGLHARLLLSFDEIETDHGWVALIATVTGVPGEHGLKAPDSEGEIERQGTSVKRTVEDAAAGAVVGASAGAAAGGAKGAAAGGAAGASAAAVASLLANRDLRLEKGATLEVRLDRALQIPSD